MFDRYDPATAIDYDLFDTMPAGTFVDSTGSIFSNAGTDNETVNPVVASLPNVPFDGLTSAATASTVNLEPAMSEGQSSLSSSSDQNQLIPDNYQPMSSSEESDLGPDKDEIRRKRRRQEYRKSTKEFIFLDTLEIVYLDKSSQAEIKKNECNGRPIITSQAFLKRNFVFSQSNNALTRNQKKMVENINGQLLCQGRPVFWRASKPNNMPRDTHEVLIPDEPDDFSNYNANQLAEVSLFNREQTVSVGHKLFGFFRVNPQLPDVEETDVEVKRPKKRRSIAK